MNLQWLTRTAASVIAVSISTTTHAQDKTAHVSAQELKAKTDYCKTCHGVDGQGFRGSFPMPRLAGQQPEYIENQLKAFIEHRRNNPVMFNVAHALSPAMLAALTAEFKNLNPKPLGERCRRQGDLPRRRSERQRSPLRILPWARGERRWSVPSPGRPALRLRHKEADELGQGARTGQDQSRQFGDHAADRARSDGSTGQSRRRLCQSVELITRPRR